MAAGSSEILSDKLPSTYEDYLDTLVEPRDLFYLEDEDLARKMVELGVRGSGDILTRDEFEKLKEAEDQGISIASAREPNSRVCSEGLRFESKPLLAALAEREAAVRAGRLDTIIFMRDINTRGHEISGYIDYGFRLVSEDFEQYFLQKKKLFPKSTDLSFFNWNTGTTSSNSTPNFLAITDHPDGLQFKDKRDRKIVVVDPKLSPGDNTTRTEIETDDYLQVVLFDHVTRRKV